MKKEEKTTAVLSLIVIIAICAVVIAVAATFLYKKYSPPKVPSVQGAAEYMQELSDKTVMTDGSRLTIDVRPQTEDGILLYERMKEEWSFEVGEAAEENREATVAVNITCPDTSTLPEKIRESMVSELKARVESADSLEEVYNDDLSFRDDVLRSAYSEALSGVNPDTMTVMSKLILKYGGGKWMVQNPATPTDTLDSLAEEIYNSTVSGIEYISKRYSIDETATCGCVPDQSKFGETTDPGEIVKLYSSIYAKNLIGDETPLFDGNIKILEGTVIRYYLDESILMVQWQEDEQHMVGTFTEVFVSDGSQLRRKIAGDTYGDMNFRNCSDFAAETNAVMASGGDFYNHARNCGIIVYNRELYRFDATTCDTCYIDSDGDLLFSYRNQFSTEDEVRAFIDENDILWSLGFGPVLIDEGRDVTPDSYAWGEINDTYARAALGMYGKHHYLVMNMNCGTGSTYGYATLRMAADAMIRRGCYKAYTLDGGQTATTAINGQLVNPVQFGNERTLSDIIYFASAVPD